MTVDTSNPDKLPWGEMPREVKAEILMRVHEGAEPQSIDAGGLWVSTFDDANLWEDYDIIRIKPEEKRETVALREWLNGRNPFRRALIADMIEIETVNGEIDKSVQPRWVE